jgi:hypothetical protein
MDHRAQLRRTGDPESQRVLGMGVHDRHDVGPRLEDRRVNEPLKIERALVVAGRLPVESELDDVFGADQLGRDRAGDQKAARILRMPDADMAIGVDHVLLGENAVGDHEILDQGVEAAHAHLAPIPKHKRAKWSRGWQEWR